MRSKHNTAFLDRTHHRARSNSKPNAMPNPYSTFTCFPRLPLELRLHIWRLTTITPRTFRLLDKRGDNCLRVGDQTHFRPYNAQTDLEEEWWCAASRDQRIPATLHACRESRHEVRKLYRYLACGVWVNDGVDYVWSECVGPYDRDYW